MTTAITDELHATYRAARSAVLDGTDADGGGGYISPGEALEMARELIYGINPLFEMHAPVRTSPDSVRAWLRHEGWQRLGGTPFGDLWQRPPKSPDDTLLEEAFIANVTASDFRRRWPEMWEWLSELTGEPIDELMSAVALYEVNL